MCPRVYSTDDERFQSNGGAWIKAGGVKVLGLTGISGPHKNTNSKDFYQAFFTCVHDPGKKGDEGHDVLYQFYLADNALFNLMQAVNAALNGEPRKLDVDNIQDVADALGNGPVVVDVAMEEGGEFGPQPRIGKEWRAFSMEVTDEQGAAFEGYLEAGKGRYAEWLERKKKRAAGGGRQQQSGRSGWGGNRGGARQAPKDDVPF